jgi:ATPase subunit of ABC transporter with duplicated ATPase domains
VCYFASTKVRGNFIPQTMSDNVILRFSDVTLKYDQKTVLDEVSFSLRSGNRITLMGQNGAGKSSLLKLISGELRPDEGSINLTPKDATVAIAHQVMPDALAELTVKEYFATAFKQTKYNLDKLIKDVFEIVNVDLPLDKKVKEFSGGQQARLLLAHALIQEPDLLLLDEPTNNLDQSGIDHLTGFLMTYDKTCLVISHDAEFLNAFSDGVLYLDVFTHKIEQYSGNYYDVLEEISKRVERENLQNARMQTQIKEKRSQAEVFSHKGGKLRAVAKRMREAAEEAEESMVAVRREDKTIREFSIPTQEFEPFFDGKIISFNSVSAVVNNKLVKKELELVVRKGNHVLIAGPNGIGKSTLLEKIVKQEGDFKLADNLVIGYYKQDFSNFDFEQKAYDALMDVMQKKDEHVLRATAAGFLLDGKILDSKIKALSEGQKGLLSFCRLTLLKPGLLILDEPTNHINFRHLPVIAKALDEYEGTMIMVSHIPEFVSQIKFDHIIDLARI